MTDAHRQQEAESESKWPIEALLEEQNWIVVEISEIQFESHLSHLGVLAMEEPTNVGEEPATVRVVRIGVRFRRFVMQTMVSTPLEEIDLTGNTVA